MDSTGIQEFFTDIDLHNDKIHTEPPPKLKFSRKNQILSHICFFLLGICHFMPITFFMAANNFWLDKFKDPNGSDSASNRTTLQSNFASAGMIANAIPVLGLGIFNIMYANKFKIMNRIILTLAIEFVIFLFITSSTQINTDDYQVLFFFVVMLLYAILAGSVTINMVASMNLFTRFPQDYMKTAFIGQGASGLVGSTLNIITVAIFNGDLIPAALMYFICGSVVVGTTLLMAIIMSRNSKFVDCIESVTETKKIPTIKELKSAFKKIYFIVPILGLVLFGMSATHSSITSLVISEQDNNTSSWAKNYFTPVMTYLLTDVSFLLGRAASSFMPFVSIYLLKAGGSTKTITFSTSLNIPNSVVLILAILRTLTITPAIWLCDAQPRSHLPVLFEHDYQYGIIMFVGMFSLGYFTNVCFLHIAKTITDPKEADTAYTIFGLINNLLQTLASPVGMFIVRIL